MATWCGGFASGTTGGWYLVLLLEFQAAADRAMAVRMLGHTGPLGALRGAAR